MDRSEGILFANMAILVDFVEKEKAFEGHVDWSPADETDKSDPWSAECRNNHAKAKAEMLEIYNWWKVGRKEEHDRYEKLMDSAWGGGMKFGPLVDGMHEMVFDDPTKQQEADRDICLQLEKDLTQKDEDMMIRLIKVRGYMWT
jgi:hypothetical protein